MAIKKAKAHQQTGNALPWLSIRQRFPLAIRKTLYLCLDTAPDHLRSQHSRAQRGAEASHEVRDLVALAVRIPAWQSLDVLPLDT